MTEWAWTTVRYESCFNRKCTCNLLRHMSVIHHTVKLPISLSESYMHTCSQRFRYTYDGHKLLWVMMGSLYLYCSLLFLLWCKPLDRHLPSLLLPKWLPSNDIISLSSQVLSDQCGSLLCVSIIPTRVACLVYFIR